VTYSPRVYGAKTLREQECHLRMPCARQTPNRGRELTWELNGELNGDQSKDCGRGRRQTNVARAKLPSRSRSGARKMARISYIRLHGLLSALANGVSARSAGSYAVRSTELYCNPSRRTCQWQRQEIWLHWHWKSGLQSAERTGNLMDGDDKTTTSAARGGFPSMADVCACGGLGPMWLNGDRILGSPGSQIIKSNPIFFSPAFFSIATGGEIEQIG
jgi:hypothetical protein